MEVNVDKPSPVWAAIMAPAPPPVYDEYDEDEEAFEQAPYREGPADLLVTWMLVFAVLPFCAAWVLFREARGWFWRRSEEDTDV